MLIEHSFCNLDLETITTPLNVDRFEQFLVEEEYNTTEHDFLIDGFRNGFDIGYTGPTNRQSQSENIPLTTGTKEDLWGKIMKEVEARRVARPFNEIPFEDYIQSPIGFVPKAGGKTHMIFHLSFNFLESKEDKSLNGWTPQEWRTVHYNDLDAAVRECLKLVEHLGGDFNLIEEEGVKSLIYLGKTDLSLAFRVLPLKVQCFKWLVFKAENPVNGEIQYFVDKCLPFGASISCSHYQCFSNALRFLMDKRTTRAHGVNKGALTNYLDDFLFLAIRKWICDQMISNFLQLCAELNIPVALEKTEWAADMVIFLGILLNSRTLSISIPLDKQEKALKLLNSIQYKKKATVQDLQVLTGYLNFLTKAIVPGQTFIRKMYNKYAKISNLKQPNGCYLKHYHHVWLDAEFRFDCEVWRTFLQFSRDVAVCRPMVDFSDNRKSEVLNFYSDASANPELGVGAVFKTHWLFTQWESGFIKAMNPSIEYLELYGVAAALLTWSQQL